MGSRAPIDLSAIHDAAHCNAWVRALPTVGVERAPSLTALCRHVADARFAPDSAFEILEVARGPILAEAEQLLGPLGQARVPFAIEPLARMRDGLELLEAAHRAYRAVYTRMIEKDDLDTRSIIPGATNALRVVMPLARALDALARRLVLSMQAHVALDKQDWRELAVLGRHLRETTFMDVALLDATPLLRPVTARALFIYPVLLHLARVEELSSAEARIVERLARRWASRVGFRIVNVRGATDNPHGPVVRIGDGETLLLDTHRLVSSLGSHRDDWLSPSKRAGRAVLGVEIEALRTLLDRLESRWSARARRSRVVGAPYERIRLRLGLPAHRRIGLGQSDPVREPIPEGRDPAAYDYGRWEQNTIVRMALGNDPVDPVAALMADGEQARWIHVVDGMLVFERAAMTPPGRAGGLAVFTAQAAGEVSGGGDPPRLMLGRILCALQVPAFDASVHRLRIEPIPGRVRPVGLRCDAAVGPLDAYVLFPDTPGAAGSTGLFLPAGLVGVGDAVSFDDLDETRTARVTRFVAHGPGYDWVGLDLRT
ncbi:MAG: hypothetical protein H6934_10360 [Burkholderiaceae bacterium]|nr:hypothetical protein [Burkholderiaceae bacterium]